MADWTFPLFERRPMADGVATILVGVRGGWRWIALTTLAGFALAVAGLRLVPPEHTASMVVGPTSTMGAAAMGARVPAPERETVSSAAEHAPSEERLSDFARYLHLLTSVPVAERLLAEPALIRALYPDRWNAAEDRWQAPAGFPAMLKRWALGLAGRSDWIVPDALVVARTLRREVVVEPVGTGPMRRVRLQHPDRAFAIALLSRLAVATDTQLRAEAVRRSATQIAHIRSRLSGVAVSEHRMALSQLLAEQERVLLMIEVDLPFAADPIEPPSVTSLPDWPNPLAVMALAAAAGLAAGVFLVGGLAAARRRGGDDS